VRARPGPDSTKLLSRSSSDSGTANRALVAAYDQRIVPGQVGARARHAPRPPAMRTLMSSKSEPALLSMTSDSHRDARHHWAQLSPVAAVRGSPPARKRVAPISTATLVNLASNSFYNNREPASRPPNFLQSEPVGHYDTFYLDKLMARPGSRDLAADVTSGQFDPAGVPVPAIAHVLPAFTPKDGAGEAEAGSADDAAAAAHGARPDTASQFAAIATEFTEECYEVVGSDDGGDGGIVHAGQAEEGGADDVDCDESHGDAGVGVVDPADADAEAKVEASHNPDCQQLLTGRVWERRRSLCA